MRLCMIICISADHFKSGEATGATNARHIQDQIPAHLVMLKETPTSSA